MSHYSLVAKQSLIWVVTRQLQGFIHNRDERFNFQNVHVYKKDMHGLTMGKEN